MGDSLSEGEVEKIQNHEEQIEEEKEEEVVEEDEVEVEEVEVEEVEVDEVEDEVEVDEVEEGEVEEDEVEVAVTNKRKQNENVEFFAKCDSGNTESDASTSPLHIEEKNQDGSRIGSANIFNKNLGNDSERTETDESDDDNPLNSKQLDCKSKVNSGEAFMDVATIQKEHAKLEGSFGKARQFVTKRGPWILPQAVGENNFERLAKNVLKLINHHDQYDLFAKEVTEGEAPGYFDIIKKPMDFGTIGEKVNNRAYGSGSTAAEALYEDFLLVMDNCALYNEENDEVLEECFRMISLLPEVYANACNLTVGKG